MKIQLKKFPNGAMVVYENMTYTKKASRLRDHFCLVAYDLPCNLEDHPTDGETPPLCIYLHRDTYVEPVISTYQM